MKLFALKTVATSVGSIVAGTTFEATDDVAAKLILRGDAALEDGKRRWSGIEWPNAAVVCIASGPSLTEAQCNRVRDWRAAASAERKVIVINTSFRLAPWADVLYACDARWWKCYRLEAHETFQHAFWTQDENALQYDPNIQLVRSRKLPGLGKDIGVIHQGSNSGYQAINLAYQAGAKRVILIGYDMRAIDNKTHWHGSHPPGLRSAAEGPKGAAHFTGWIVQFKQLAIDLNREGMEVLNATPNSALSAFPKIALEEALCAL